MSFLIIVKVTRASSLSSSLPPWILPWVSSSFCEPQGRFWKADMYLVWPICNFYPLSSFIIWNKRVSFKPALFIISLFPVAGVQIDQWSRIDVLQTSYVHCSLNHHQHQPHLNHHHHYQLNHQYTIILDIWVYIVITSHQWGRLNWPFSAQWSTSYNLVRMSLWWSPISTFASFSFPSLFIRFIRVFMRILLFVLPILCMEFLQTVLLLQCQAQGDPPECDTTAWILYG